MLITFTYFLIDKIRLGKSNEKENDFGEISRGLTATLV